MAFKRGDRVTITWCGQTKPATISIVSGNQLSIGLAYDTEVPGRLGLLLILGDDDGVYRSIAEPFPVVTIEPARPAP